MFNLADFMLACVPAQALPLQGASSCSLARPGLNCKGGTLPLNPPLNPLSTASGRPQWVGKLKRCRSTPYNPPVQPHAQPPAQPLPKGQPGERKNRPVELEPAICCSQPVPTRPLIWPSLARTGPPKLGCCPLLRIDCGSTCAYAAPCLLNLLSAAKSSSLSSISS